jgi:GNAT superfamily N-acetyltransferase
LLVRPATTDDIPALVDIHLRAIPDDVLPRLGARFLAEAFLPIVLNAPDVVTLVCDAPLPSAFVVFAFDEPALTARLMRNRTALARAALARLASEPGFARDIVAHARGFRMEWFDAPPDNLATTAMLYVMATLPGMQSLGIGARLLQAGLEIVFRRAPACLVKTSSLEARRFYEQNGFRLVGNERRGFRALSVLYIDRPAAAAPAP